jgi:hypothetical protein
MNLCEVGDIGQKRIICAETRLGVHELQQTQFPTDFIACLLLATDWSDYPEDPVKCLISELIVQGAVFLGFWGAHSATAHGLAEDMLMLDNPRARALPIPIAWEDQNTLAEEIWHFVFSYTVDAQFQDQCSWIIISIDGNLTCSNIMDLAEGLTEESQPD